MLDDPESPGVHSYVLAMVAHDSNVSRESESLEGQARDVFNNPVFSALCEVPLKAAYGNYTLADSEDLIFHCLAQ